MATSSPLNGETFLAVVAKSTLVDPERLRREVDEFKAAGGDASNAMALAEHLTAKSLITKWQSEKLLQGKHKGYFLSKYKLLSLLGKGGMSSVFLAEHTLMKRRCAIKVLPHKRVADSSYLARFHREAQAVASLDHPNIVRAYDVDHQEDRDAIIHFLVMEHVDGLSLQDLVTKHGPCSLVDSVDYVRQSAVGLAHAHQAGLVHRDIKPGNLLRDNSGVVKILDLGLARFFDNQGQEQALTIQHDEKVLGTADYLAPEQALDSHTVDARADIYSLGCTLYFLLTGHPPFTEGTLTQRLMAHQTKEPPPVEKDRPEIPPTLSAIVRKMMAKKPDDRYATAQETAEALRKWLSVAAPPEWKKTHRELFAVDAAPRQAPVMAQVVNPVKPASPSPPTVVAPPPSSKLKLVPPPVAEEAVSSNIFSFGSPAVEAPAANTGSPDPNFVAFFDGLGFDATKSSSSAKATPQAKSSPKVAPQPPPALVVPSEPKVATPAAPAPKSSKPSSVLKKQKAPSTIVSTSPAAGQAGEADFSFLSTPAPVAPPTPEPVASNPFDFLAATAPVVTESPPVPPPVVTAKEPVAVEARTSEPRAVEAAPIIEPPMEIATETVAPAVTEGLFQFGNFTTAPPSQAVAPPEPVGVPPLEATYPPDKPVASPPKTKHVAKVVAPVIEPTFNFGTPANDVTAPATTTPFDWAAPPPSEVVPPATEPIADPVNEVLASETESEAVASPTEMPSGVKKKAKPGLPVPALPDRRVLIGVGGGVAVVLLAGLAYGLGFIGGGGTKAVATKGNPKKTASSVTTKTPSVTTGAASKSTEWSRKRTATVGASGDFKTLADALETARKHFKPSVRSERFTIKVAAGTYAERIVLDGKTWPNNIVITGDGGAITLEPSGAEPIIKIDGIEGVQISNVLLKAQGKPVAVELGGNLARVRLQKFTIQGFGETGILIRGGAGLSFSDARCQIEEGQFEPGGAAAVGVKVRNSEGKDPVPSTNILLAKLKFLGPMAAGIAITGKENSALEIRQSIFAESKAGVQLLDKTLWNDFLLVNNTFYKCPNPVLIAEQPDSAAKGLSLRRNLFVESGPEVFIEKGFDEKPLFAKYMIGLSRLNFSTRPKPEMPKQEVPVFGDGGQQGNAALKFASTDPKHARFLAPAENAPQRNVGGQTPDEQPYVGAVAP